MKVKMNEIYESPVNVRQNYPKPFAKKIAKNIDEFGLLVPIRLIKIGKKYHIRSGHNRFNSLKANGVKEIEIGKDAVLDDRKETMLIESFLENKIRRELTIIEEADGLLAILKEKYGNDLSGDYFIDEINKTNKDIREYTLFFVETLDKAKKLIQITKVLKPTRKILLSNPHVKLNLAYEISLCDDEDIVKKAIKYMKQGKLTQSSVVTMIRRKVDLLRERDSLWKQREKDKGKKVDFTPITEGYERDYKDPVEYKPKLSALKVDSKMFLSQIDTLIPEVSNKQDLIDFLKQFRGEIKNAIDKVSKLSK